MIKFISLLCLLIISTAVSQVNTITLRDGYSKTFPMLVTKDSAGVVSTVHTSRPFELAINMGQVPGYETLDKFGYNPVITTATDPEDIWEGGGLYTYDADGTAPIVSIASNNAADNGILTRVEGLDINGNFVSADITLTGTTRIALPTPLFRVFRIQNRGTSDYTGNVFVYTGTGAVPTIGDPEVRAVIINGNNQTLMSLYTIPKEFVGFLYRGEIGIQFEGGAGAGTNYALMMYKSRRYGSVFTVKKVITCVSVGSSLFQDYRSFPDVIPGLTDIRLQVVEVSDTMGAWGTFDIMLIPTSQFSPAYLAAIGQPGFT